ncbi:hypothetical protein KW784_02105 [Candidatus Parcubacteria bacterium]|nr:hypothetical protein [Candidatus Parcubacteria bacterium]
MNKEQLEGLRKKKNELIWNRGPAREIMRLARIIFREVSKEDLPGAHVMLASDHYSLIKRYMEGRFAKFLAAWHGWRATWNVNVALGLRSGPQWSSAQIDVISRIMAKVPKKLGGDPNESWRRCRRNSAAIPMSPWRFSKIGSTFIPTTG